MLGRDDILDGLTRGLRDLPYVLAMWEGGAAAFDRVDRWSDMDVQLAVEDDRVGDAMAAAEQTLAALSPIAHQFAIPEPTWHGHAQTFFRLADADPFCVVDLVVMKQSSTRRYDTVERHGRAVVRFDKVDWLAPRRLDEDANRARIRARLAELVARFEMFHATPHKELLRGRTVDALAFYQGVVVRPLVEALRMRHDPARFDFGPRYVREDLPADVVSRLERLYYVPGPDALERMWHEASAWFREVAAALENA